MISHYEFTIGEKHALRLSSKISQMSESKPNALWPSSMDGRLFALLLRRILGTRTWSLKAFFGMLVKQNHLDLIFLLAQRWSLSNLRLIRTLLSKYISADEAFSKNFKLQCSLFLTGREMGWCCGRWRAQFGLVGALCRVIYICQPLCGYFAVTRLPHTCFWTCWHESHWFICGKLHYICGDFQFNLQGSSSCHFWNFSSHH